MPRAGPCGRRCRACGTFPSSYRSSAHLPATMASSDSSLRFRAPACAPFGFGLRRRFPSSSALRCIPARSPEFPCCTFRTRDPPMSRAGACASLRDRLRRPALRFAPAHFVSTTQVDSIASCWLHDVRTLATRNFSNETLCRKFTCVTARLFVRQDSRTSVADYASLRLCRPTASIRLCTACPPNRMSISLRFSSFQLTRLS